MYSVSTELYEAVTAALKEAVGDKGYFSGSIAGENEETEWRLTISVMAYRETVPLPDGDRERITDLAPVWWEFHTVGDEGEMLNDFSFSEVRESVKSARQRGEI